MARYFPLLETHIVLRTMIFGAGTAAGATWIVDDGGAGYVGTQVEAAG